MKMIFTMKQKMDRHFAQTVLSEKSHKKSPLGTGIPLEEINNYTH